LNVDGARMSQTWNRGRSNAVSTVIKIGVFLPALKCTRCAEGGKVPLGIVLLYRQTPFTLPTLQLPSLGSLHQT